MKRPEQAMIWVWSFLLVLSFLGLHTGAQKTDVTCYNTTSDCTGDGGMIMSYIDCCSQANSVTDVYYRHGGQCRQCGPVITNLFPETVTSNSLTIQWSIAPNSLISSLIQVTFEQEGSTVATFPSIFNGETTRRHTFLLLVEGEIYIFTVTAMAESGVTSLPFELRWKAGKSPLPMFDNFNQIESTSTSVSAGWALTCNGFTPMEQMTVQWREDLEEDSFPSENIAIFNFQDQEQPDGMEYNYIFQNLVPDTRYAVRIRGTNSLNTSSTLFTIETGPAPQTPSQGSLNNHTAPLTSSPTIVLLLLATSLLGALCNVIKT